MPGTLECLLRLALAALCGGIIGLEREIRLKEAGVRTHLIVGFASCMMMIVSKYGFFDMLEFAAAHNYDTMKLDPSRIAAGLVTAGLWATVGIGMTTGAGMYWLSIFGTCFIVVIQAILHRDHVLVGHVTAAVFVQLSDELDGPERLRQALEGLGLTPSGCKFERRDDGVSATIHFDRLPCPAGELGRLLAPLMAEPYIKSLRW